MREPELKPAECCDHCMHYDPETDVYGAPTLVGECFFHQIIDVPLTMTCPQFLEATEQ